VRVWGCCVASGYHHAVPDYSPEHHKRTRKFWWVNGADSSQLPTFLVFAAEYQHFKQLAVDALSDLEEKRQQRMKKVSMIGLILIFPPKHF